MLPDIFPDECLQDYLTALECTQGHIDLSLARMQQAATALQLLPFPIPVITVAGTNGKGSVVCALENIYTCAGYRVGSYTSPHLFVFNERIKINARTVSDAAILAALQATQACASDYALTYFEIITLAALWLFKHTPLDLVILEVGLGGRLDAVNIIDPILSMITSIDLDHTDRLGTTRAAIAQEKAGIFRAQVPILCGEPDPPAVLQQQAKRLQAPFYCIKQDFNYYDARSHWDWADPHQQLKNLPDNGLLLENMSLAVAGVMQLRTRYAVPESAIRAGLAAVNLPGRQQIVLRRCKHIFDVAHNPAGLKRLAQRIQQEKARGRVCLVFSMLSDKNLLDSCALLMDQIDAWFVAPLAHERAATQLQLQTALQDLSISAHYFPDISSAYQAADQQAEIGDLLVVAGSFYTVVTCFNCIF